MNTFIIVSVTPTRVSLKENSMLVHSKNAFLLLLVWQGTEYTWAFS